MRARLAAGADGEELQMFCNWLLELGEGRLPGPEDGIVQLPPQLVMDADVASVIDWTFGGLQEHHADRQWMASRAILAPRNTSVDEMNAAVTERFPGEAVHLLSADSLGAQDEIPEHPQRSRLPAAPPGGEAGDAARPAAQPGRHRRPV